MTNWQDIVTVSGVFFSSVLSAREIPNYPFDKLYARYLYGLNISIYASIVCCVTNTNDYNFNVPWLTMIMGIDVPFIIYVLIISLGFLLLVNSVLQVVIVEIAAKSWHNLFVIFVAFLEFGLLIHLLIIS